MLLCINENIDGGRVIAMNKRITTQKRKPTAPVINLLKHLQHLTNMTIRRRHERIRRLTQFRRRKS